MSEQDTGDTVVNAKAAARRAIRAARRERLSRSGAAGRAADAAALAEHGMAWLADRERQLGRSVTCVTAYEEMATEPPMTDFIHALTARGITVLVPVTLPEGVLSWRAADPERRDNPMNSHGNDLDDGRH
ncbi:MAG: hypothetical protein WBG57_01545, partial [Ornithinimicrobium sp.]